MKLGKLKELLEPLPDDIEVKLGYGDNESDLKYLTVANNGKDLLFHSGLYMCNPREEYFKAVGFILKNHQL